MSQTFEFVHDDETTHHSNATRTTGSGPNYVDADVNVAANAIHICFVDNAVATDSDNTNEYIVLETVDHNELIASTAAYSVSDGAVDDVERCGRTAAYADCVGEADRSPRCQTLAGAHDEECSVDVDSVVVVDDGTTGARRRWCGAGSRAERGQRTAFTRESMWPI